MSHFNVLVVLPRGASDGALDAALQPFHEYASTGVRDKYVVFVDEEDEYRADFAKPVERWRDPADGTLYHGFESVFYRGATKREAAKIGTMGGTGWHDGICYTTWYDRYREGPEGARLMVQMEPGVLGFERVELSGEAAHGPFDEWVEENHGAVEQGGRWGRLTNPNSKWDWWRLGGRWSGLLLTKPGAVGVKGEPGTNPNLGSRKSTMEADEAGVDIVRVGDMDLPAMKARNVRKRRGWVDGAIKEVMKAQNCSREEVVSRWVDYSRAVVQARADWNAAGAPEPFWKYLDSRTDLPALVRERTKDHTKVTASHLGDHFGAMVPEGCEDLEAYIEAAPALDTHAVLTMNGTWHQRGEMGWWGAVHDEKDAAEWEREYSKMLSELDPDSVLAVVDCHI